MPTAVYNVNGWASIEPWSGDPNNPMIIGVGYLLGGGENCGAQFAQGIPEVSLVDGSSDGDLVSYKHEIYVSVASGVVTYWFQLQNNTTQLTSFTLSGGSVGA